MEESGWAKPGHVSRATSIHVPGHQTGRALVILSGGRGVRVVLKPECVPQVFAMPSGECISVLAHWRTRSPFWKCQFCYLFFS